MDSIRTYAKFRRRLEGQYEKSNKKRWEEIVKAILENQLEGKFRHLDNTAIRDLFVAYMIASFYFGIIASTNIKDLFQYQWLESEYDSMAKMIVLKNDDILKSLVGRKNLDAVKRWVIKQAGSSEIAGFFAQYGDALTKHEIDLFNRRLNTLLTEAFERGEKLEESVRDIVQKLKEFTYSKLRVIGATEITRAYNSGILTSSFYNPTVGGYRFQAVLDNRTSQMCRERHGMYIPKNDIQALALNTPPLHPNCRSRLIPVEKIPYDAQLIYSAQTEPIKRDVDVNFVVQLLGG